MSRDDEAEAIIAGVGGAQNIADLHHCSTRLRFTLHDDAKADLDALKAVPVVMGALHSGSQTQVVVGSKVADVHRAVERARGGGGGGTSTPTAPPRQALTWRRAGATAMDFVISVFTPIVPAIAGAGILKSLLVALAAVGWLPATSETYLVLSTIPDAVFAFLPVLVAYTAAKKLGVNVPLAIGVVAFMLFVNFSTLVAQDGGVSLLGLDVPAIAYSAQVFPAILAVLLLWPVEKFVTRISPGPIRVFFVPFVCYLVVGPITMLVLGPLGFRAGSLLTGAMVGLYDTLGWVAVALLAALLPFIISVGMHKAFVPPTIATMSATGRESFYLVASLAHNFGEAGACFAIAIRTRDPRLRATAISAGISALFGITEPALYGITLQNRRALVAVIAGALAGGAYLGLWLVSTFAVVGPGLASFTMFVDAANPWNIFHAAIGGAVAVAVSFVVSIIIWRDSASATLQRTGDADATAGEKLGREADDAVAPDPLTPAGGASSAADTRRRLQIVSPVDGELVPLADVDDAVFSSGVLGEGVAVRPSSGAVVAPLAGVVTTLLDSRHAVGITADDGVEVLVHVGLDTVKLEGRGFTAHVAQGDRVEVGQALLDVDLASLEAAGYDTTTPVVVTNTDRYDVVVDAAGHASAGRPLITTTEKELTDGIA
ncbi:PTS system beta-glucoside-specific IIA component (Glc family) /PTS system beta-glucoside-specific IIB component (Glc family) /PTS system beta-glucoside-specific IIC component (Glc family) [Frigoribacterium sp. PhB160]|uniref:beta-glucoside-specific PTS transporter subunit IIABC n=1 Tax=Frigoribacterium sp. PhB160 TaxID=2485192 RepID=UPI000F46E6A0|nr:beta-glucoside-specific PTS transporter subunit IIABC [Frigoribacterium sp. PhB160]ROS58094.1 PTS system beta-glucoside-specific IIA component (Glc family) /PTS system beta-glucoside-specific IIB component (Glc family) /PTS system beta-glucoside-specific IIC component (Glc family) [Frigoribacterium sp. PhB160]